MTKRRGEFKLKVYLRKDLVKDLDTDALLAYIALRSIYHKDEEEFYVSINMLCYRLFGDTTYTRAFKDSVINGLNTLVDRNLIVVKEKISKMEFVLNGQGLYFENVFFIGIDLEYIRTACHVDARVDKGGLIKYLLTMVGTLCNDPFYYQGCEFEHMKGTIGFMPISYIAQEACVSEATALSYNTILENEKIMYIYHFRHTYYDEIKERIKTLNNVYGLFEHRDNVLKFAKGMSARYNVPFTVHKQDANKRRSLAAKYNAMCRGKQYSEEETKEILEYIKSKERYNGGENTNGCITGSCAVLSC